MPALIAWEQTDGGELDVVEFDSYDSEDWSEPCEISEFPVELAPGMTDQVVLKPITCTLVGYISEKPLRSNDLSGSYQTRNLNLPATPKYVQTTHKLDLPKAPLGRNAGALVSAGIGALVGAVTGNKDNEVTGRKRQGETKGTQAVRVWTYDSYESRVAEAMTLLEKARTERKLVRVLSDHKDESNLIIESLDLHKAPEEGSGAQITLNLRQIHIATTETVAAPKPAENLAQRTKAAGSKAAEKAGDDEVAKLRSIAKGGVSGVMSLLGGH